MDFASLMKSQIAAAKPKDSNEGGKKYLKRSELEAQRQEAYLKEQAELERAQRERLEKKRKHEEEEAERKEVREEKKRRLVEESRRIQDAEDEVEERARRKRLGLPELVREKSDGSKEATSLKDGEEDVEDVDLRERLRELGEPRMLFGESHVQRLRRWRRLNEKALAPKLSSGPIPTSIELLGEKDMKIPTTVPADTEGRKYLHRQLASYFDMVLSEWANALARRPKEVKESFSGKQAFNSFLAARDNLKPLFRKLEADSLADDILKAVVEIVQLAQSKQYVSANDAYLRLSIGKAAWPIGVTMVGIHERSAREKLNEHENGAHIMSDEITRKLLQGIKRCLSFAQTRWPPDDLGQLMG